ncbi:exosortase/archaeosortase family protein [Poriferisphaera corsica]|uniref:exosortase/archaeosortase family protein n=1 Tax=Poriferisphaera corsica TaxID=2528020 RepID=UPI00190D402A|nr:exosortase/archaeosortase family protein [Poriferisphaera corsica]
MTDNASIHSSQPDDGKRITAMPMMWSAGRLGAIVALMLVGIWATFSEWMDIWHIALTDEEASHIFLVPIILVWLVSVRKDQIPLCNLRLSFLGPLLIGVGWVLLWSGFNHSFQSGRHAGAIAVVSGCFLTFTGWDVVKRFWPAFVVLAFMVPIPGQIRTQISVPMQTYTAAIAQFFSVLIGMTVERSGNVMSYNGIEVAVAEACNGMRMIFALLLVSFAFAFGTPLRTWVRIVIILLSPVIAVICNVIRLIPTVYVYGQYSEGVAEAFHDYSGWFMLLVALGMMFGIVHLLNWLQLPVFPKNNGNGDLVRAKNNNKHTGESE